jgi:hypothetical protein
MEKKNVKNYLFIFLIIVCVLNLFLLKTNTSLSEINTKNKILLQRNNKSEKIIFRMLNYSNQMIGKTVKISNLRIEEDIQCSSVTPLLIMRKDMCSTCKDQFFLQLEKIRSNFTWTQEHLKLILLDESYASIGSGAENFIRKLVNELYFIKRSEIKLPKDKKFPEVLIVVIDSEMKIRSYFEFNTENLYLLKKYLKLISSLK